MSLWSLCEYKFCNVKILKNNEELNYSEIGESFYKNENDMNLK